MATIIEYIKQLCEITDAGGLECRIAFEKNNYNYENTLADLKEMAVQKAAKRWDAKPRREW